MLTPYLFDPFDDLLLFPSVSYYQQRPKVFTKSVDLSDFKKTEIQIDDSLKAEGKIKIHAVHNGGENDYYEKRLTVDIPAEADRTKIKTELRKNGVLIVAAPYLNQQQQQRSNTNAISPYLAGSIMPFGIWGHLTDEMRQLENEMKTLFETSFPGSVFPSIVKDESTGQPKAVIDFELTGFKPEEISIRQEGRQVFVNAKHESQTPAGGHTIKNLVREFSLPESVQVEKLSGRLMPNGHLRIEAPCELKQLPPTQEQMDTGHDISIQRK